jgi:hypothetical protein
MQKFLVTLWCLLPLAGLAYHYGPGQERLRLDEAAAAVREARMARERGQGAEGEVARGAHAQAVERFTAALALLPSGRDEERARWSLERAKSRLLSSQLPIANAELAALVDELEAQPDADPELLADARGTYANSEYYMTWLARLEGVSREEWEPRIERARQTFKLLAEDAARPEAARKEAREDLESSIRLARMDLEELAGLPIPSP